MPYFRVECLICHTCWNYFDKKVEYYPQHTAVQYLGCVCPECGSLSYIEGGAQSDTNPSPK